MRIVQYHPRASGGDGGITNSVRRLSEALARAGAQAIIVSDAETEAPDFDGVIWRMIEHRRLGRLLFPVAFDEAIRDADLVVLNSAWTLHNVLAARTARRLGIPYVLAPRGAYDPHIFRRNRVLKMIWWWTAERRLVSGACAIHVFFSSQGQGLAHLGYMGPVLVAPNGVAVPIPPPSITTGGYFLYLGRFDPEHKGLDLLVRAVAAAPRGSLPLVRMHGPDWANGKERVMRLVDELGVGDRILIGDAVYDDAKWQLLAAASGFIYPSRWEGFGNAAAEACALGVPTVVTPYPLGRYLADHDAAILADPTVDALLAALTQLNSPKAAAIGQRAARLVRETFTWDSVAQAWIDQAGALLQTPVA